jgi:ATP synthase F1 epsilon subunit
MSLKVCVMAPDRVFWNATADEIILPTNTGQMGILTNHTPLITGLDIGVMLVREENGTGGRAQGGVTSSGNQWVSIALMGGFALIKENIVTILVNDAELAESLSLDEAEKAFLEAQVAFEKAETRKEKIEKSLIFKRARARLQLVKK